MVKKTLLLVTNYYPYFHGEEYLETEILYLSESYSEIIIIPTMNSSKMEITRKLPENCVVLDVNYNLTKIKKINFLTKKVYLDDLMLSKANSFIKKLYLKYFEVRSLYIFKVICNSDLLSKISNTDVDIYSYWFYVTARVSILLKELLIGNGKCIDNLVSRAHRYDLYENESRLNYLPEREFLLSNLDTVFPCSEDGKMHIISNYPSFASKVKTSYLGTISGKRINESKSPENIIVSCSGLRKVKQINILIDALEILDKQGFNFKWIHFGDGPEKKKLVGLASSKINKEKFIFRGSIKNQDLQDWYDSNNVDLFVNVSRSEGIPVSIMEIMSRGIPVLVTDAGGSGELIDKNGVLLEINPAPEKVANNIRYILSSKTYNEMCSNSYSEWNKKFNANKNYTAFVDELLKIK